MNRNFTLGVGVIIIIAILGIVFLGQKTSDPQTVTEGGGVTKNEEAALRGVVHHIVLTTDGYEPKTLAINSGDTVSWSVAEDVDTQIGLHWPASNLHPSHRDYPGGLFDPERPVSRADTWEFVFHEVGTWKYHDHLMPYYTGTILVE